MSSFPGLPPLDASLTPLVVTRRWWMSPSLVFSHLVNILPWDIKELDGSPQNLHTRIHIFFFPQLCSSSPWKMPLKYLERSKGDRLLEQSTIGFGFSFILVQNNIFFKLLLNKYWDYDINCIRLLILWTAQSHRHHTEADLEVWEAYLQASVSSYSYMTLCICLLNRNEFSVLCNKSSQA